MPAHKFLHTDLRPMENEPLQGNFHLLVVGTFNPDYHDNNAPWFYGRPENEFWSLLPRMMDEPTMHAVDRIETSAQLANLWQQFCQDVC